ncbi:MAG: lysozyme [Hyphomicrobiaceae bacterium]|jgi:GH24 family phage-related lysozyme (muramidase)|nr:lysozyme [Hyphomicrobiaceae bacterium]
MTANYLDAIRKFEGFTPKADWDYAQFTNGYGTKAKYAGEVIDKAEADRRFQTEIAQARAIVDRHAPHVDEGTKAALTSLTFNAGDKWARSGLGEAIRSGDTERARELFLQYNKAGGEVLPGLAQRRIAEAAWIGQPMEPVPLGAAPASAAAGPVLASGYGQRPMTDMSFLGASTRSAGYQGAADRMAPMFSPFRAVQPASSSANAPVMPPAETAAASAQTAADIEDELALKIRGAVSGFGGEARMTQLLLATKLIGAPSAADKDVGDKQSSAAV